MHLRGGGICSGISKQKQNKNINNDPNKGQLVYPKVQSIIEYPQIKEFLELIVNQYKEWNENKNSRMFFDQFEHEKNRINEILKKQDDSIRSHCLDYYLDLINLSLEKLPKLSKTKGKMIIKFCSISQNEKSISELIKVAHTLLIKVQCLYYTQFQKFKTYFFFNTLKQIIKDSVVQNKQIDIVQQFDRIYNNYIQYSTNWTLYHCWIELLVDLLIFCHDFQQQRQNVIVQEDELLVTITNYITKKDVFGQYFDKFQYKGLSENQHLSKILSELNHTVKLIENQYEKFQQATDFQQVKEIFHSLYSNFIFTQICCLEILNQSEKNENIKAIRSQIIISCDIQSFINYYCYLQMIQNNNDKDGFKNHKGALNLKNQIKLLRDLIKDIFLLERFNQYEKKQNTNYISIQYSEQSEIQTQFDLQLKINTHLLLLKNQKQLQKIYHLKLQKMKQISIQDLQDQQNLQLKIYELKKLKQNSSQIQPEFQLTKILENPNYSVEQYVMCKENLFESQSILHEAKLEYIYEQLYEQIGYLSEDKYKVKDSIISLYYYLKQNRQYQQLMQSLNEQIRKYLKQSQNLENTQPSTKIEKLVDSYYSEYLSTTSQIKTIVNKELVEILKEQQKFIVEQSNKENQIYIALNAKSHNLNQQKQLFIEFQPDQNPQEFVDAEINNFIWNNENRDVILILQGHIGCGKTNVLQKLERQMWQVYNEKIYSNWIPIYIDWIKIKSEFQNGLDSLNKLLMKAVETYFPQLKNTKDIIKQFCLEIGTGLKNVVLILDNYDSQNGLTEKIKLQRRIKNCDQKVSLKIIIAIRNTNLILKQFENKKKIRFTEILTLNKQQKQEYIKQIKIKIQELSIQVEENKLNQKFRDTLFEKMKNCYIMSEQDEFILKGKKNQEFELQKMIQNKIKQMNDFLNKILIPHLIDILLTPQVFQIAIKQFQNNIWNIQNIEDVILSLIRKINLKNLEQWLNQLIMQLKSYKFFDGYYLYDTLYLESMQSINLNGKIFNFQQDVDLIVFAINALQQSKYKALEKFIEFCHKDSNNILQYLSHLDQQYQQNLQIIINNNQQILSNSILITQDGNTIQFFHYQILEFLFAKKIYQLLNNKAEHQNKTIEFLNNEKVNLSNQNYAGVVELLIDESFFNEDIQKRLSNMPKNPIDESSQVSQIKLNLIEIVKESKNNQAKKRASSNAIFLLSKLRVQLESQDFSGIKIENTSIIGLQATNCDFRGSQINNVKIDFINFKSCKMENAKFKNVICSEFPLLQEDQEIIQVLSFCQDEKLVVLKQNGIVNIWIIKTLVKLQKNIQNPYNQKYKQIIISKYDIYLFALTDYKIDIWTLKNCKIFNTIQFTDKSICFCLSPDNTQMICSLQNQQQKEILIWSLNDQIISQSTKLSLIYNARQMAINNLNDLLIFQNEIHQIKFVNLRTLQEIPLNQSIHSNIFTTTQDGQSLITYENNTIIVYSFKMTNGNLLKQSSFSISIEDDPKGLHICTNTQTIIIQCDQKILICNTHTKEICHLGKKFNGKNNILTQDGDILISWKYNKIQLWDLDTLKNLQYKDEIECCKYSPNGKNLLMQQSEKLIMLNIETNKSKCILESISSFCFSPNNDILVTFSNQGLKFWSIKLQDQIVLMFHFDEFKNQETKKLIYSQNCKWLACINQSTVTFINISNYLGKDYLQTRVNSIKVIPNQSYNQKDQFCFVEDLISYSYVENKLFKRYSNNFYQYIMTTFDLQNQALTISSKGKLIAYVNQVNNNPTIFINNISDQTQSIIQQVIDPIDVIQFSYDDKYLVTFNSYSSRITIYNQKLENQQVIDLNRILLTLQFHPQAHQFIILAQNGEILFYIINNDKFEKFKTISGYQELSAQETAINDLQISSRFGKQNLRQLLIQKGAKN